VLVKVEAPGLRLSGVALKVTALAKEAVLVRVRLAVIDVVIAVDKPA
jgi:hypothetical protein